MVSLNEIAKIMLRLADNARKVIELNEESLPGTFLSSSYLRSTVFVCRVLMLGLEPSRGSPITSTKFIK